MLTRHFDNAPGVDDTEMGAAVGPRLGSGAVVAPCESLHDIVAHARGGD